MNLIVLNEEELLDINGGLALEIAVAVVITVAFCAGVIIGYDDGRKK